MLYTFPLKTVRSTQKKIIFQNIGVIIRSKKWNTSPNSLMKNCPNTNRERRILKNSHKVTLRYSYCVLWTDWGCAAGRKIFYCNTMAGPLALIACVAYKLSTVFYIKHIIQILACVGQALTRTKGSQALKEVVGLFLRCCSVLGKINP